MRTMKNTEINSESLYMARKKALKAKERELLSLAELFEVGFEYPTDLDGFHFETKIRAVCKELVDHSIKLNEKSNVRIKRMELEMERAEIWREHKTMVIDHVPGLTKETAKLFELVGKQAVSLEDAQNNVDEVSRRLVMLNNCTDTKLGNLEHKLSYVEKA